MYPRTGQKVFKKSNLYSNLDAASIFDNLDKKLLVENLLGLNSTNHHIHLLHCFYKAFFVFQRTLKQRQRN